MTFREMPRLNRTTPLKCRKIKISILNLKMQIEIINNNILKTWYRNFVRPTGVHYNVCPFNLLSTPSFWHRILINLRSPRVVHITVSKFFSYVGTGLPGLNQYKARINVSCSRTQYSEARTPNPSISRQALYHRAPKFINWIDIKYGLWYAL